MVQGKEETTNRKKALYLGNTTEYPDRPVVERVGTSGKGAEHYLQKRFRLKERFSLKDGGRSRQCGEWAREKPSANGGNRTGCTASRCSNTGKGGGSY